MQSRAILGHFHRTILNISDHYQISTVDHSSTDISNHNLQIGRFKHKGAAQGIFDFKGAAQGGILKSKELSRPNKHRILIRHK